MSSPRQQSHPRSTQQHGFGKDGHVDGGDTLVASDRGLRYRVVSQLDGHPHFVSVGADGSQHAFDLWCLDHTGRLRVRSFTRPTGRYERPDHQPTQPPAHARRRAGWDSTESGLITVGGALFDFPFFCFLPCGLMQAHFSRSGRLSITSMGFWPAPALASSPYCEPSAVHLKGRSSVKSSPPAPRPTCPSIRLHHPGAPVRS
jgi:hypothetical protein